MSPDLTDDDARGALASLTVIRADERYGGDGATGVPDTAGWEPARGAGRPPQRSGVLGTGGAAPVGGAVVAGAVAALGCDGGCAGVSSTTTGVAPTAPARSSSGAAPGVSAGLGGGLRRDGDRPVCRTSPDRSQQAARCRQAVARSNKRTQFPTRRRPRAPARSAPLCCCAGSLRSGTCGTGRRARPARAGDLPNTPQGVRRAWSRRRRCEVRPLDCVRGAPAAGGTGTASAIGCRRSSVGACSRSSPERPSSSRYSRTVSVLFSRWNSSARSIGCPAPRSQSCERAGLEPRAAGLEWRVRVERMSAREQLVGRHASVYTLSRTSGVRTPCAVASSTK